METLGIYGCGLMGTGIAEVAAVAGHPVRLVKATPGDVGKVREKVRASLDKALAKGKLTAAQRDAAAERVRVSDDPADLAPCSIVIESSLESLPSKRKVLAMLEGLIGEGALLATNTSSLPLAELASALTCPARFVGMHFFSPAQVMKLVEIGGAPATSRGAIERAEAFARALGKTPIVVGDAPGYIVNRLLVPMLCHAIETLDGGIANAADIDAALKLGAGHPVGPLALADLIGLDVVFAMAQTLCHELRDQRFRPPSLLRRLVHLGHLGKKVGLCDEEDHYRGPAA